MLSSCIENKFSKFFCFFVNCIFLFQCISLWYSDILYISQTYKIAIENVESVKDKFTRPNIRIRAESHQWVFNSAIQPRIRCSASFGPQGHMCTGLVKMAVILNSKTYKRLLINSMVTYKYYPSMLTKNKYIIQIICSLIQIYLNFV